MRVTVTILHEGVEYVNGIHIIPGLIKKGHALVGVDNMCRAVKVMVEKLLEEDDEIEQGRSGQVSS